MTAPTPREAITRYLFAVLSIVVTLSIAAFAVVYWGMEERERLHERASDYHLYSLRHTAQLKEALLQAKVQSLQANETPNTVDGVHANPERSNRFVLQAIQASVATEFAILRELQTRYNDKRFTSLIAKAQTEVSKFVASKGPSTESIVLPNISDEFLITLLQIQRLHSIAYEDLQSAIADQGADNLIRVATILILLLLPGGLLASRLIGAINDVLRKQKEDTNTVQEARISLANAQRIAKMGNWEWNIQSGDLSWSDEVYRVFGRIPQEFAATYDAFLQSIHPDDRQLVQSAVNQSIESGKPYSIEHRVIWPDGTLRYVHERGEISHINGHKALMNGTVQDITQRKMAENKIKTLNETLEGRVKSRTEALALEKEKAETYLSIAGTMIIALDRTGTVSMLNRKGEEVLGYSNGSLIGRNWFETVIPEDQRQEIRQVFAQIENGDLEMAENYENNVITQSGVVRLVRWHNAYVRDEEGRITSVLSSGEDITDQRAAEEELRRARDDAEAANRAKSDFLSNMSHELRTPMNAILGFGQLLQMVDAPELSEKHQGYVEHIMSSGQHLLTLINEVLDLSQIESGKIELSLEPVEVNDAIADCLELTVPLAEKRSIKLDADAMSSHNAVSADFTRLKQVILNLLSNAIKYNHEGGTVRLRTEETDSQNLRISIEDNGPGIPQERQSELFKPFSRLGLESSAIEGTGIGLSLTKRLIELMGGSIGFQSTYGSGSTFWVELPLGTEANGIAGSPVQRRPALRAVDPNEALLLYVEDNPSNLRLMESIVDRIDGLTMLSAHSAELGLELALAHYPDVILLDINLPGLDGYKALSRLRSFPETRTTPVLALSALAMPKDVEKGLKAGFREYLTKPVKVEEVTAALFRTLNRDSSQIDISDTPDAQLVGKPTAENS